MTQLSQLRRTEVARLVRSLIAGAALALSADTVPAVENPNFQLPPGFTVELVAGPPLVNHPTMGGFDDQGRLYICDGPGENMPAKDLLEKLPNNIRRLEDADGDGKFDKSTMYADKMTFPMGALWHEGDVYTASPPHIWKLRDTNDDGVADERKILVSEFGFTGNAADIHGCFLGPEGRIYWCDGRHGHNFTDKDGNPISKGLAARIFSCKTDGTDVQAFAGGGMDNPVEICFTEEGEMLGTVAIFDNKPDRVDAIVHWVYGGAYPYHEKVLGEFKKTGDLLPAVSRFGRVAPAGIVRYRGNHLGDEYTNDLFHAQFNTHRVVRTKLTRSGATFTSVDEDFLVSENPDVHLTDVIEDADGSLLVVDTGGWFRIGCPNSQIAKPDILGGIYRIRRTGGKKIADPRGTKIRWARMSVGELLEMLDDKRPAVKDRAKSEIVRKGNVDDALLPRLSQIIMQALDDPSAIKPFSDSVRRDIVWSLAQSGGETSYILSLSDLLSVRPNPSLQQVGLRSLHAEKDSQANDLLSLTIASALVSNDLAVRREAATCARVFKNNLVEPLLNSLERSGGDRFLEHAVIYSLIQIGDAPQTATGLVAEHPNVRRGALIALDQMGSDLLTRDKVAKLLDTPDAALQSTVLSVMQKHPDWASAVVDWLQARLADSALSKDQFPLLQNTLVAYKTDPTIQQLLADALANKKTATPLRLALLEAIERSELAGKQAPPVWIAAVERQLAATDDAVVRQAIVTAKFLGAATFRDSLLKIVSDGKGPEELSIVALQALGAEAGEPNEATFSLLAKRLTTATDPLERRAAADVLGVLPLSTAQHASLVDVVAAAGPLELPALLSAFEKNTSAEEAGRVLAALEKSPGLTNVTAAQVERIVAPHSESLREAAAPIFKRINADLESQKARLLELAAQMEGGDVTRGKNLFTVKKTSCIACHRVGTQGGNVGPDLSKVGQIRSQTDILESILFPSASFVRGFESVAVVTDDGREVTGILSRETPEAVYIKTTQREEIRIPRDAVDEINPSKLSIMPTGLDKVITREELRDIVAYLRSLK